MNKWINYASRIHLERTIEEYFFGLEMLISKYPRIKNKEKEKDDTLLLINL